MRHSLLSSIIDAQYSDFPVSHIQSHLEERWHYGDKVVLLGDSAHSVFHFYAQGLNAALEDARIFAEMMDRNPVTLADTFASFQNARYENIKALQAMSEAHFFYLKDEAGLGPLALKEWIVKKMSLWWQAAPANTYRMVVRPEFSYRDAHLEIQRQRDLWCFVRQAFLESKKEERIYV